MEQETSERFTVVSSPIHDGRKKIPQFYVYDNEQKKRLVGYSTEKAAKAGADHANAVVNMVRS